MQVSPPRYGRSLVGDKSSLVFCGQSTPRFSARFFTKAADYKLRPNEEMAERLAGQLLPPNFEKETQKLSIGWGQLPWMIRLTALFWQFHPGSYTRSLFYQLQEELKKSDQPDKANRLFVRLQLNRSLYPQKPDRTIYTTQKTMTSQQYHPDSQVDETTRHQKAWVLYDMPTDFLSALTLPKRNRWQPFIITIGFVPQTVKPVESLL